LFLLCGDFVPKILISGTIAEGSGHTRYLTGYRVDSIPRYTAGGRGRKIRLPYFAGCAALFNLLWGQVSHLILACCESAVIDVFEPGV
jgi:hypothetical protein